MGFVPPPVNQPPAVVNDTNQQEQRQDQFQDQVQNNTVGELLQKQQTESDADSSADSSSVNSASQSNIQVNNNSNRVEYEGFKLPETTFNLSVYGNEDDLGVIGTISVPIGGRPRKTINRALEIRAQRDQISFETEYASACANIGDGGYVVTKSATTLEMLKNCDREINKVQLVARNEPPVVNQTTTHQSELDLLRQQNQELKLLLQQLMAERNDRTVNGGF